MKVFLSSTYKDLKEYRRAAMDGLRRLNTGVRGMEFFGARPEEPVEACLSEVEACELFVGIYAHRYGYIPDGSQISITEQELRHAQKEGKPTLCFLVDEKHPWPPQMIEGGPGQERLGKLKKSLSRAVVLEKFTTPGDLALKVATSVSNHLAGNQTSGSKPKTVVERIYRILPSLHLELYGRAKELDSLARFLSAKSPEKGIAIQAIGGMGKTALAREYCFASEVWDTYDLVLGAQALKRQINVNGSLSGSAIRFHDLGTVMEPREFLVTLAEQLNLERAGILTVRELETEIVRCLDGKSALIVLDNLETMKNTVKVLELLDRICLPPTRKALITTRRFPANDPAGFKLLRLGAIQDASACRQLVVDRISRDIDVEAVDDDAIKAVVEVGQGHPLALELLTGKLVTRGSGAILTLREEWRKRRVDTSRDEFLSALCNYVFDDRFQEQIGEIGVEILSVMAKEAAGIDEDAAREASGLSDEQFNETLTKLFEAGCIRREIQKSRTVLAMHSITQTYFRSASK